MFISLLCSSSCQLRFLPRTKVRHRWNARSQNFANCGIHSFCPRFHCRPSASRMW